jgi:DNA-binding LytR/AlgR family response regulator
MEPSTTNDPARVLDGARLLVVEDDFLILLELEAVLLEAGAATVRLCGTVDQALQQLEESEQSFGAAILDIKIGRANIAPVARALDGLGVPFVFYTGQPDGEPVRSEWPECVILSKPAPSWMITAAVARLMRGRAG